MLEGHLNPDTYFDDDYDEDSQSIEAERLDDLQSSLYDEYLHDGRSMSSIYSAYRRNQ